MVSKSRLLTYFSIAIVISMITVIFYYVKKFSVKSTVSSCPSESTLKQPLLFPQLNYESDDYVSVSSEHINSFNSLSYISKKEHIKNLSIFYDNISLPPHYVSITYADGCCSKTVNRNTKTMLSNGFDESFGYNKSDIPLEYIEKYGDVLAQKRGGGYWLWKPIMILETLKKYPLSSNVIVFYSDAGVYAYKDMKVVLDKIRAGDDDFFVIELSTELKYWTKRDTYILMGCDEKKYYEKRVAVAGINFWKNTLWTRFFLEEWIRFAGDERIISDNPNVMGKENIEEFKDHRHDQSVLSLLLQCVYKEEFYFYWNDIVEIYTNNDGTQTRYNKDLNGFKYNFGIINDRKKD